MFTLRLHNLHLRWESIPEARLYINPMHQVFPPVPNEMDVYKTTGNLGTVELNISGHLPGVHILWIIPKDCASHPVGPRTATGFATDRIYRALRIQFTIDNKNNVTNATIHPETKENGELGSLKNFGNNQVLDVYIRPVWMKSNNFGERKHKIDMIVVHKTGSDTTGSPINTFLNPGASSHYIVGRDGHVVKMVLDEKKAFHASHEDDRDQSHWGTQTGLASRSIGIENVGTVKQDFTDPQYQALTRLIHDLMKTHGILRHRVVAHSDILTDAHGNMSPERIACPGHSFEWSRLENAQPPIGLARRGGPDGTDHIGALFDGLEGESGKPLVLKPGDFDPQTVGGKFRPGRFGGKEYKDVTQTPIADLQTWLAEIGYSVGPVNGQYNSRTAHAVKHFQVHFEGRSTNDTINAQTAALIRAVRKANPRAD